MAKLESVKTVVAAEKITVDGKTFMATDAYPKAGDIIRVDELVPNAMRADVTQGGFYPVLAAGGQVYFSDDAGDDRYFNKAYGHRAVRSAVTVFTPVAGVAKAPVKDPRFEFKNGEKVRLVSGGGEHPLKGFDNGGIYVVDGPYDGASPTHYNTIRILRDGAFAGYAKPHQIVKVASETVKIGEHYKVVAHGGAHNYTIGDIVEVTRLDDGNLFHGKSVTTGKVGNCLSTVQCVPATAAEVAAARKTTELAAKVGDFKVGDLARLKDLKGALSGFSTGDLVKVTETGEIGTYKIAVHREVNPGPIGFTNAVSLEKISAEEAKWLAIGRKVNEFKVGDVVKYVKDERAGMHGLHDKLGVITTIDEVSAWCGKQTYHLVKPAHVSTTSHLDTYTYATELELIAPVESLFTK
jgi:hypothetical protein